MLYIDKYAYFNALRNVHPAQKFLFSILSLVIVMISGSLILPTAVFILMSAVILMAAKIPANFYARLLLLPLFFLGTGVLSVALDVNSQDLAHSISLFQMRLGFSSDSLALAARLFARALASISCLYFLILTTPVTEIFNILRRLKFPVLFLELLMIVYKFIFILLDTANRIHLSQTSRLGYSGYRISYSSLSKLTGSLFVISLKRYEDMYNALESRCFTGDFHFQNKPYLFSKTGFLFILVCDGLFWVSELVFWSKI